MYGLVIHDKCPFISSPLSDMLLMQVDFRLDFVEKILEGRPPNSNITPVLVAGLDLVNAALEKQPIIFVEHGWRQIYYLAGRVMQMQKENLVDKLCSALTKVYLAARSSIQVEVFLGLCVCCLVHLLEQHPCADCRECMINCAVDIIKVCPCR